MLEKDVILSKFSIIRNCLSSIAKVTGNDPSRLNDFIVQDVFVLNLQRAVQACIDVAHVVIALRSLPLPASYRQSFEILRKENLISAELSEKMIRMTGFRNIAVHDYRKIETEVLKSILQSNLRDLEDFINAVNQLDEMQK